MAAASRVLIGVDVGGTKTAVVAGIADGQGMRASAAEAFRPSPDHARGAPHWTWSRGRPGLSLEDAAPGAVLSAVGVSCGGPLDSREGLLLSPPNLPGWDDVPVVDELQRSLGCGAFLQNDANACALAEWRHGAGVGTRNMVFLTFGTGMGAGLIMDGRLYEGTNDYGGEVGHIRLADDGPTGYGKAGSFEGFCSGGGIALLARAAAAKWLAAGRPVAFCAGAAVLESITAKDVGDAAEAGDPLALEVLATSGRWLGRGLALLMDILNPQLIVIGSIFVRCRRFLQESMEAEIAREALPGAARACAIAPAKLGDSIGDYACLSVAADGLSREGDRRRPEGETMNHLDELMQRYPVLVPIRAAVEAAFRALCDCYASGGKLMVCGNGGSAADADHIVGELMKGYLKRRPVTDDVRARLRAADADLGPALAEHLQGALPAVDLTAGSALLSAFGNDVRPELAYAQAAFGHGRKGDVLLGISTSGNAANVRSALVVGRAMGMTTIALTGRGGGRMAGLCDVLVSVPATRTFEVQELHLPVYHCLCAMVEERFFT